jgi:hypothetical protein
MNEMLSRYGMELAKTDFEDKTQNKITENATRFLKKYYKEVFKYNSIRRNEIFKSTSFNYLSINKFPVYSEQIMNISSIKKNIDTSVDSPKNLQISINKNITFNNSNTLVFTKSKKRKTSLNRHARPIIKDEMPSLAKYYHVLFHAFIWVSLAFFGYIVYTVFVKKQSLFVMKDPTLGPRKKDYFEKIRSKHKGKIPRHTIVYI